ASLPRPPAAERSELREHSQERETDTFSGLSERAESSRLFRGQRYASPANPHALISCVARKLMRKLLIPTMKRVMRPRFQQHQPTVACGYDDAGVLRRPGKRGPVAQFCPQFSAGTQKNVPRLRMIGFCRPAQEVIDAESWPVQTRHPRFARPGLSQD